MENSRPNDLLGLHYWLQWQVPVCALFIILPSATALALLRRNATNSNPFKSSDLWMPRWRNLHPGWLLFYRTFAFAAMAYLLYQIVAQFGFFVFLFYTQWTFVLVMVYFALGCVISARGCLLSSRKALTQVGEKEKLLKKDPDKKNKLGLNEQKVGFEGRLMQIIYQICGGAVMLTDIVFWCLLLPFMIGENFKLTLLVGCMHSVNVVLLLLDSSVNSLPFPWFGLIYFVLWSCIYAFFLWVLHACCFTWWPYPFLELSTPWAPMWYLGMALVHLPCYGLYVLLVKAKDSNLLKNVPPCFYKGFSGKEGKLNLSWVIESPSR